MEGGERGYLPDDYYLVDVKVVEEPKNVFGDDGNGRLLPV